MANAMDPDGLPIEHVFQVALALFKLNNTMFADVYTRNRLDISTIKIEFRIF
jgi:hypothetical protein